MHLTPTYVTLWQLFLAGGPFLWLIAVLSLLSFTVIIDKVRYFLSIEVEIGSIKSSIREAMLRNDLKAALKCCDEANVPITRVLKAGILNAGKDEQQILAAMELQLQSEVVSLESHLSLLHTLAVISVWAGLIGAVIGMAYAFNLIQARIAALNPLVFTDAAGPMWSALLSAGVGLLAAFPAVVFYNYFVDRISSQLLRAEAASQELSLFLTSNQEV